MQHGQPHPKYNDIHFIWDTVIEFRIDYGKRARLHAGQGKFIKINFIVFLKLIIFVPAFRRGKERVDKCFDKSALPDLVSLSLKVPPPPQGLV